MPVFDYQCECGLKFSRPGKLSTAMEAQVCQVCGAKASRVPPESIGHTFKPKESVGITPQNTGMSDYDYNADRIIGTEASESWETVSKREESKREVMRASGKSSQDLSLLPGGAYRVMHPEEKKTTRNTRAFNNLALGLAKSPARYQLLRQVAEKQRQS
jgi:hypothetical protein